MERFAIQARVEVDSQVAQLGQRLDESPVPNSSVESQRQGVELRVRSQQAGTACMHATSVQRCDPHVCVQAPDVADTGYAIHQQGLEVGVEYSSGAQQLSCQRV